MSLERETYWELIPTALIQEEMKKVDLRQGEYFSARNFFEARNWDSKHFEAGANGTPRDTRAKRSSISLSILFSAKQTETGG